MNKIDLYAHNQVTYDKLRALLEKQRGRYNKGLLTSKQVEKLDLVGFLFNAYSEIEIKMGS